MDRGRCVELLVGRCRMSDRNGRMIEVGERRHRPLRRKRTGIIVAVEQYYGGRMAVTRIGERLPGPLGGRSVGGVPMPLERGEYY